MKVESKKELGKGEREKWKGKRDKTRYRKEN